MRAVVPGGFMSLLPFDRADRWRIQISIPGASLPIDPGDGRPGSASDPVRADAELATVRRQRDTAWLARNTAERARSLAEDSRNALEQSAEHARREVDSLKEQIAFLEEQMRGGREYSAELVERRLGEFSLERSALLQEIALLNEELQNRAVTGEQNDSAINGIRDIPLLTDALRGLVESVNGAEDDVQWRDGVRLALRVLCLTARRNGVLPEFVIIKLKEMLNRSLEFERIPPEEQEGVRSELVGIAIHEYYRDPS
jgi:hypothetical protein